MKQKRVLARHRNTVLTFKTLVVSEGVSAQGKVTMT